MRACACTCVVRVHIRVRVHIGVGVCVTRDLTRKSVMKDLMHSHELLFPTI